MRPGRRGCLSTAYQALINQHEVERSLGRWGDCYGNALPGTTQAKSRWSRFKSEELDRRE